MGVRRTRCTIGILPLGLRAQSKRGSIVTTKLPALGADGISSTARHGRTGNCAAAPHVHASPELRRPAHRPDRARRTRREARAYWESGRAQALAAGQAPPEVTIPVGVTTFPGEVFRAPRSWVEAVYPSLTYFNEVDSGGHFAAWEEPQLFSEELRAAFASQR